MKRNIQFIWLWPVQYELRVEPMEQLTLINILEIKPLCQKLLSKVVGISKVVVSVLELCLECPRP